MASLICTPGNREACAQLAGLKYISDSSPGIRRFGTGKNFRYKDARGRLVRDEETLRRIKRLVIPPAWTDVWISPDPDGYLQAVGRDARGRKQYRYHVEWRTVRDETKYYRMLAFGRALPRIRARVQEDLAPTGLTREKVLATIIRLIDMTSIRVGNEEYMKQNQSVGLTTMRNHHVGISGQKVSFYFRGKSGVRHRISVEDRHLARTVRRLRDLPGYELFQYVDDDGNRHSIQSTDVNNYLREITDEDFTSKDFRTWNGTVLAAAGLCGMKPFKNQTQARKNVVAAVKSVSQTLGNTPAVCRKCYVHPAVFDAYVGNTLSNDFKSPRRNRGLSAEESALLCFLSKVSKAARKKPSLEGSLRMSVRSLAA
jgi:DNA topoisomerase I